MVPKLEQFEFKLEKKLGFRNMQEKLEKYHNYWGIKLHTLSFLRIEAQNENDSSRWFLYQSIILIVTVMTCVAPLIVFLTVKSTILGEVHISNFLFYYCWNHFTSLHCLLQRFIKALAISGSKVTREQKRSEKLILALLPPTVAARIIEQKVIF